jgi:hypothetical protein
MSDTPLTPDQEWVVRTWLDDEHLVALGEVAYWSARAERTLALVVSTLISRDSESGVIATNGLGFNTLADLGTRLVAQRVEGDQVRVIYKRLASALKKAMETRNHLLHGEWTRPAEYFPNKQRGGPPWAGPTSVVRTRSSGPSERTFTVHAVRHVAHDLALVTTRLFALFMVIESGKESPALYAHLTDED